MVGQTSDGIGVRQMHKA